MRIVRTIETHTHADHVSGHGRLALEHGIPVSVHADAGVDYPHDPMRDGDEIEVGAVTLGVIHTPGHRPEHCCLTVVDRSRGDEPWLVLTGDSLFVGDAARPDLAVGAHGGRRRALPLARRLLELSDGVEVFPGPRRRVAVRDLDELEAVDHDRVRASLQPDAAAVGRRRVRRRVRGRSAPRSRRTSRASSPRTAARSSARRRSPSELAAPPPTAQLLDVRAVAAHLAGHRPGAISVPVSGTSFATKAGFVLDAARPVCVLAETCRGGPAGDRRSPLGRVLRHRRLRPRRRRRAHRVVAIDELEALIAAGAEVIDVREKDDRDTGYIPGSRNVPYRLIAACCPDLPTDRPVVTICDSGPRAAIAASILRARGYDARPVVDGGMIDWRARGGDTVEFSRCGSG